MPALDETPTNKNISTSDSGVNPPAECTTDEMNVASREKSSASAAQTFTSILSVHAPSKLTDTRNSSQKEVALANLWYMPRRLTTETRKIVKIHCDAHQLAVIFREISLDNLQEAEVHRMPTMAHDNDVQMKSNSCSAIRNTSPMREHNALIRSRATAAQTLISVLSVRALSQMSRVAGTRPEMLHVTYPETSIAHLVVTFLAALAIGIWLGRQSLRSELHHGLLCYKNGCSRCSEEEKASAIPETAFAVAEKADAPAEIEFAVAIADEERTLESEQVVAELEYITCSEVYVATLQSQVFHLAKCKYANKAKALTKFRLCSECKNRTRLEEEDSAANISNNPVRNHPGRFSEELLETSDSDFGANHRSGDLYEHKERALRHRGEEDNRNYALRSLQRNTCSRVSNFNECCSTKIENQLAYRRCSVNPRNTYLLNFS